VTLEKITKEMEGGAKLSEEVCTWQESCPTKRSKEGACFQFSKTKGNLCGQENYQKTENNEEQSGLIPEEISRPRI
jgi:hypothetical protein